MFSLEVGLFTWCPRYQFNFRGNMFVVVHLCRVLAHSRAVVLQKEENVKEIPLVPSDQNGTIVNVLTVHLMCLSIPDPQRWRVRWWIRLWGRAVRAGVDHAALRVRTRNQQIGFHVEHTCIALILHGKYTAQAIHDLKYHKFGKFVGRLEIYVNVFN